MDDINRQMREPEKIIENVFSALSTDYAVIGRTRVRSWHAWLMIGLISGIVGGITLVANRTGEFETSEAASLIPGIKFSKLAVPYASTTPESAMPLYRFLASNNSVSDASLANVRFELEKTWELTKISDVALSMWEGPGFEGAPTVQVPLQYFGPQFGWGINKAQELKFLLPYKSKRYFEVAARIVLNKYGESVETKFKEALLVIRERRELNLPSEFYPPKKAGDGTP